jgi:EmrB/QacA subfamily drug resistance transporter
MATSREKQLTLIAAILGSGIVFLDATVVNIALPAMRSDLGGGLAGQQWVVEAYLLTLSSLLLIGGSLGDIFGQRRVFSLGLAGFGATSMLCAIAPSIEILCVSRALQGVFGALLTPSTLAIIVHVFPDDERGKAIGTWTAFGAVAGVIGPLAGGLLISAASWRLIFVINVPVVLATMALVARGVPESAGKPVGGRVDVLGALLGAAALAGPVFGLTEQPTRGWDGLVLGAIAVGVVAGIAFLVHEARSPSPMLPLNLFRHRNFTIGNVATLTTYTGLGGLLFVLPLFLQQVGGYTPVQAGLSLLPITASMFLLSRRFGALADRVGPRLLMGIGPLVAASGVVLLLVGVDRSADYVSQILPGLVVFGFGLSMMVAPLTATVLGAVEQEHAGIASGVNNALARVAGLVAVALIGAVVSAAFTSRVDAKLPVSRLDPAARAAVARARAQPLGGASLAGVPARERAQLKAVFDDASVRAFRVGVGIAALLIGLGGVLSLAGIRDPRRKVTAEECPAGALCGASGDLARTRPQELFGRRVAEQPAAAP